MGREILAVVLHKHAQRLNLDYAPYSISYKLIRFELVHKFSDDALLQKQRHAIFIFYEK